MHEIKCGPLFAHATLSHTTALQRMQRVVFLVFFFLRSLSPTSAIIQGDCAHIDSNTSERWKREREEERGEKVHLDPQCNKTVRWKTPRANADKKSRYVGEEQVLRVKVEEEEEAAVEAQTQTQHWLV